MPALSNRVLVEYVSGARKYVSRSQLPQLSPLWKRVKDYQPRKKTSAARLAVETPNDEPAAPDNVEE